MTAVSVIGLGRMGTPIAWNLLRAGHDVTVWNRSPAAAGELVDAGAHLASSPAEAMGSEVVLSMLADDRAVEAVVLDSGALGGAGPATVHVNLATVSTALARRAADEHAAAGVGYVAAPVFGRPPVAEAGNLVVVAAGAPADLEAVQPVLEVIGARTWRVAATPESANAVKIVGNYLLASAVQAMGEGISLAEAHGVDPGLLVELLTSSIFPGPVYTSYGTSIARRSYDPPGFTVALGRKDLQLALTAAAEHGIPLPFGQVLDTVFTESLAAGWGDWDLAAIGERQPRRAP